MAIQESNIVFLKSQVMDDVPEGGGAATGTAIPDGVMNNVFEDISDLDRAYGRFNLRKIFLAVRELGTSLYGGAKTVVTALPEDPSLGYTLFTTNDPFDLRTDAASRVEAYLYKGPMWHGALNENHITGMRAINVIQNVDTALPPIGKTLCLVQDEGEAGEKEQYVRVIDVEAVTTEFEDDRGTFYRWIVRMDLSDALRHDFLGHTVNRYNSYNYADRVRIRDTTVADATQYFSSRPLALAAEIGDLSVKADGIYTQLVPSAQTETPLVDQLLSNTVAPMVDSRGSDLTYTVSGASFAPSGLFAIESGFYPGSVSATISGVTITDDGAGNALRNSTVVGTWNYATGECRFNTVAPTASGTATVSYRPAVAAAQPAHNKALGVTVENRRLNWIETLSPIPAPGTLSVAYLVFGNWYVLTDNGQGIISGTDPTFGTGTISYVTGVMAVTLGALPDAGSQILLNWGSAIHYEILVTQAPESDQLRLYAASAMYPGSISISWVSGGTTYTATDDGAGALTGDGTGYVMYAGRTAYLTPNPLPDLGSTVTMNFDPVVVEEELEPPSNTFDAGAAVAERSVIATITLLFSAGNYRDITLYDNGAGVLMINTLTSGWAAIGDSAQGALWFGRNIPLGTVNYATGAIVVNNSLTPYRWVTDYVNGGWGGYQADGTATITLKDVRFSLGASLPQPSTSSSITFGDTPAEAPTIRLTGSGDDPLELMPNSLVFSYRGRRYVDRDGVLFTDIDATGAGVVAGSVDYETREATVTRFNTSGSNYASLAALGVKGLWPAVEAGFRTAATPIKSESLAISATTMTGAQITGTVDADGVISGAFMRGTFDYTFGVGFVEFGSGNPSLEVSPATLRYNAVAYSYVPLDADILGIDAVRLPADGRVPIFRAGNVVQVIHAATTSGTPTLNGATGNYELSCGRTRIGWVKITDTNGAIVTDGYTLDRANGIVSWASIAGLDTPVMIKHTVGDLRLVTDAQIDGTLTLARPLTHDFPLSGSLVCACLIHGDRRARVSATWDQSSWNSTWVDYQVGSAATATLNTIDFPITVTNEGCDTDRWVLRFLSTTSAELISEKRGLVWTGTYTNAGADIAPINPRTRDAQGLNGTPYLTIPAAANGGGWSAGNVVRINTVGAIADFWMARSIAQSDEPLDDGADGCEIYALGNIDRP